MDRTQEVAMLLAKAGELKLDKISDFVDPLKGDDKKKANAAAGSRD